MQSKRLVLLSMCIILSGFIPALSANRHVPSQYPTIQAGITAAVSGDHVIVADGLYWGDGNRDLDFMGKIITVKSANGPDHCSVVCSINSTEIHRFATFSHAETSDAVLDGFTVFQALHSDGGAISCQSSSPTIQNCKFVRCKSSSSGGAISLSVSRAKIFNCLFDANETSSGEGGALYANNSYPVVASCEFRSNYASTSGGAISLKSSTGVITNCLFVENFALASSGGGIVFNACTNTLLSNSTFINNYAYWGSALLFCNSPVIVRRCILWDPSSAEVHTSVGEEPSITYSDIRQTSGVYPGAGNINELPLFTKKYADDYHLSQIAAGQAADSPCVNSGGVAAEDDCFTEQMGMFCLSELSTRYDNKPDTGEADMGFHYAAITSQDPTPTSTPFPTPTPSSCSSTGVSLWMPSQMFHAGDSCSCNAYVCNATGSNLVGYPLFVILNFYGSYYFAPSFSAYDNYLIEYPQFSVGESTVQVFPEFAWPVGAGSASGLIWIAALTDPQISELVGESDSWTFGWE